MAESSGELRFDDIAEKTSDEDQERSSYRLKHGTIVAHFRILRLLGRGGMGLVYLARDLRLGRKVAIKIIRHRNQSSPEPFVRNFVEEARTTAQFNHPNIVTLLEVGEHEGYPYLALEYVNGESLLERSQNRALGRQEIIRFGAAMASALVEAHAHKVLHLDLKPGNIVIGKDGRLRVLDFGLAQPAQSWATEEPFEIPGLVRGAGTPAYMAPEQWRQEPLTAAADIWALGIVLYELVLGRRPYEDYESGMNALGEAVTGPDPVPRLPSDEALCELVARCLDKVPNHRPTALEVKEKLQSLIVNRVSTGAESENPFRGLGTFTRNHAAQFYGREREITELVERLEEEPILPIVGASGEGKSSLVNAGMIPRLTEQDNWQVLLFRPGFDPFKSLAGCLEAQDSSTGHSSKKGIVSNAGKVEAVAAQLYVFPENLAVLLEQRAAEAQVKVLVVVDQLEELYTLCKDIDRQNRFIRALTKAADDAFDPVRVVFTIRDDFLHRLAAAGPEVRVVLRRMMLLQAPEREALIETLVRPVQAHGYTYEDESIVEDMVASVEAKPSSLPLLQFTAHMLWERRDRVEKRITKHAYQELGGVAGALAHHADRVLDRSLQADVVQKILLRMVTPEDTRRAVVRDELLEGLDLGAAAVLDALLAARLVTTVRLRTPEGVQPAVELAHESLIHRWSRLRGWIDAQRDELRFLAEVQAAAELWVRRGRASGEVWRRGALAEAQRMLDRCTSPVPSLIQEFIEAGRASERRRTIKRRGIVTVGFIGLLIASAVLFVQRRDALQGWDLANKNQARAEALRVRSERSAAGARNASRFASATLYRSDPTLVLALVREMEPAGSLPAQWRDLARWAMHQPMAEVVLTHPDRVTTTAFSPDGRYIATGSEDTHLRIWKADGSGPPLVLKGHEKQVTTVAFSPDGRRVVTASRDMTARVWWVDGSRPPVILRGHESWVNSATFGPDGRRVVTASSDNTARIWPADGSGTPLIFRGHESDIASVDFSPDGTRIVTGAADSTARIWRIDGSAPPIVLRGYRGSVYSVAFSPDGTRVVTGSKDRMVRIWPTEGKMAPLVLEGHQDIVHSVAFSPDGTRIVSGARDNSVRVWRTDGFGKPIVLGGHQNQVMSVSYRADGTRVATASLDHTVRVWRVDTSKMPVVFPGHQDHVFSAAFSPDGTRIVTASLDHTAQVWKVSGTDKPIVLRGHQGWVYAAAFSPDSKRVVTASNDQTARVWNADGSGTPIIFRGHQNWVRSAAFSPDGARIVTAANDFTVQVWNADGSGTPIILRGHTAQVFSASFSPDGTHIVSASQDGTARIWRADGSGTPIILRGHEGWVRSASFSPDGTRIVTASTDKTARIWDFDPKTTEGDLPFIELRGHEDMVFSGAHGPGHAFSPDGTRVVTISFDRTMRIWDTKGATPPVVLQIPDIDAFSASFSPDGTRIVTTSYKERNLATGKLEHWATVWPTFEPFSGLDDPTLWMATRYCPPVELRIKLLNISAEAATAEREQCQKRVAHAFGNRRGP